MKVREEKGLPVADLLHLVAQVVPYHMTHNAEPEAVDLLLEVWEWCGRADAEVVLTASSTLGLVSVGWTWCCSLSHHASAPVTLCV